VRHIMEISPLLTVAVNTAELTAATKRVALVAERNTSLRLAIGEGLITLEAATGDQAQASESIEALVRQPAGPGDPTVSVVGFNPAYLLDALGSFDTPYVHFGFTAASKPCQITGLTEPEGEPLTDYRHVIMLMRLPT
jgi:DNA polymerase-3 subunit beta